jgi:hypothetical protein
MCLEQHKVIDNKRCLTIYDLAPEGLNNRTLTLSSGILKQMMRSTSYYSDLLELTDVIKTKQAD